LKGDDVATRTGEGVSGTLRQKTLQKAFLVFIMGLYLAIAGLYAIRTPDWQSPDEPAHYNYIAQIAEEHRIPVIEPGDWNQTYLDNLKTNHFAPELLGDLDSVQYEDHQPPLYYLLATPVYLLTDGSLTALRLYSVLIGTVIVYCSYATGLLMFPNRPWIGLGAAAFVAFLPQQVHILASVNNDALGWAVVAATLFLTVAYIKDQPLRDRVVQPWQLGLLVGIGFITKTTTYFMAGAVLIAILLHWWTVQRRDMLEMAELTFPEEVLSDTRDYRAIVHQVAMFLIPALLLGGVWWLRNISVYGFPDFLGLAEHNAVVIDQPRTADRIDLLGLSGYLREMSDTTFDSFWGQFGWMAVPMQSIIYTVLKLFLAVALSGLAFDLTFRHREENRRTVEQRNTRVIMASVAVLSILAFAYYNAEFQQYQGRYLFTLLIPLSLWLALGLDAWRRFITRSIMKDRSVEPTGSLKLLWDFAPYGLVLIFMAFAVLDVYLLWRVIVPNLS
jgi:hypothetical protein